MSLCTLKKKERRLPAFGRGERRVHTSRVAKRRKGSVFLLHFFRREKEEVKHLTLRRAARGEESDQKGERSYSNWLGKKRARKEEEKLFVGKRKKKVFISPSISFCRGRRGRKKKVYLPKDLAGRGKEKTSASKAFLRAAIFRFGGPHTSDTSRR